MLKKLRFLVIVNKKAYRDTTRATNAQLRRKRQLSFRTERKKTLR